jgi:hypothetical protein
MDKILAINKGLSQVLVVPCYQTQVLSMTENHFLFLIRQKMQFPRTLTLPAGLDGAKTP